MSLRKSVAAIKCHFDPFRSNVASIMCHFDNLSVDGVSLRSNVIISIICHSMKCHFKSLSIKCVFIKCRTHCRSVIVCPGVQDGTYALGKSQSIHYSPSLKSFPNVAFETVRLIDDGPFWHPLKEDRRKL